MKRPESVMFAGDPEVLGLLIGFHGPPDPKIADVTANKRRMWRSLDTRNVTFCDIDPSFEPDHVCDFRSLPFEDGSYDILVFDPPHLPKAAASPRSHARFASDFGLATSISGDNVAPYFRPFLSEASRVLKPDGLVFAKIKDYVHHDKYQWMLAEFVAAVRDTPGLTPCDLIVKRDPAVGGNFNSGRWKRCHHVRNVHSWWVTVRKGKCQRRNKESR